MGVLRTSMVWKSKSAVLHFVTAGADVAPVHDVDNGFRVAQGIGADQSGSPSNVRCSRLRPWHLGPPRLKRRR